MRKERASQYPLTGIGKCGACGGALATTSINKKHGRYHAYYRCRTRARKGACEAKLNVRADTLEEIFDGIFTDTIGDLEVKQKITGNRTQIEAAIAAMDRRIDKLERDYAAGRYDTEEMEEVYWRLLKAQTSKKAALKEKLESAKGDTFEGTGKKYREVWVQKTQEERKEFLRDHGVTMRVWSDLVPRSGVSAQVDFGDLAEMAESAGLMLPAAMDGLTVGYRMPRTPQ